MKALYLFSFFSVLLVGCSPLKTSPHDERYRLELTIHEVQTNLDDLRHDTNCSQTEIQILDGRIKCFENALAALKQQEIEKQQSRLDQIAYQLQLLEKKWVAFEKKQEAGKEGLEHLSLHASETNMALTQFKGRIEELEREVISQNRRLEGLGKLKGNIENLAKALKNEGPKIYKVRPGDSLEKIARAHKTDVSTLKQLNQLQQDLIVVDQELKVP
jgi:chromosome segregation ATPase